MFSSLKFQSVRIACLLSSRFLPFLMAKDNFRTISMAISKSQSAQKPRAADPEFRFAGNKKQYQLNKEVLEKTDEALATDDG